MHVRAARPLCATQSGPSQLIDARIKELGDWRGRMLSRLRTLVKEADPEVVEEWKWRGVPVWNTRRAIDFHEGDTIDEQALKTLVRAAVTLNTSTAKKRSTAR
jgi:hypothetical protein